MLRRVTPIGLAMFLLGLNLGGVTSAWAFPLWQAQSTPIAPSTEPPLPPPPPGCELLRLVGGEGGEVTKTVSVPSLPIPLPGPLGANVRNNWNTDWAVAGGRVYRKFVVTFLPRSNGTFNIQMFLKYSDNTADRFFNEQRTSLNANEVFIVETIPQRQEQPFQVNVMVGGADIVGRRYSVSVAGCP
ncbi:MAG: hypothetical protein IGS50_08290 [Synechococcales cyanobacterium C42_A2020_086]|nr:hypothetical protein [Synechococcales cyanobacterium M58_A2018_015]MBF2073747.1 hypothetical protein [Synechococcales cyanobacterium C42_A2020_086]